MRDLSSERMTKRRVIFVAAASLITFTVGSVYFVLPLREPAYDGKRVSGWCQEVVRSQGDTKRATEALQKIGSAAVPYLVKLLKRKDGFLKKQYLGVVEKLPPWFGKSFPRPVLNAHEIRRKAVLVLGEIGPSARQAVPQLIKLLKDPDTEVRLATAHCLGAIGTEASESIAALAATSKGDPDPFVRGNACYALGKIGPASRTAVPILIQALADTHAYVRHHSVVALGGIGPSAAPAVPALTQLLTNRAVETRIDAALSLSKIEPHNAASLLPTLAEVVRTGHPLFQVSATRALVEIVPATDEAESILIEVLRHREEGVRWEAVAGLGRIAPRPVDAIPALIESLSDQSDRVAGKAAFALGQFGPPARSAIPALHKSMKHEQHYVRDEAAAALRRIEQERTDDSGSN